MPMDEQDVVALTWQGGGGFGDPLERDPEAVVGRRPGRLRLPAAAGRPCTGVVLDADGFDAAATEHRRRGLRQALVGTPPRIEVAAGRRRTARRRRSRSSTTPSGWAVVCCGEPLVRESTRWRAGAVSRPFAMPPGNPPLHPDLAMTAWYCPHCARRLAIDVHEKDEAPADDIVLDLRARLSHASRRRQRARQRSCRPDSLCGLLR